MFPLASSPIGEVAETATVPEALGMTIFLLDPDGVVKVSELVKLPDVSDSTVSDPWRVKV